MKSTWIKIGMIFLAAALAQSVLVAQKADPAEVQLKAAIQKEVEDGDLKGAIEAYKKLATSSNRTVAAQALVRLGQCYQKLGAAQTEEARKAFERVITEFADQAATASQARAGLAALRTTAQPGQQAARMIWSGPGADDNESSVSVDGRFATFPDWDTGNLALHDFATGTNRSLTGASNSSKYDDFAEASAISRDGKRVAYAWYDAKSNRYELRVASLSGEPNPRKLFGDAKTDYIWPWDWSPDAKWIAAGLSKDGSSQQIGLIGALDGSFQLLRTGKEDENLQAAYFSPDGRFLLYTFTNRNGKKYRSFIISADGRSEAPLIPGDFDVKTPVWSHDGSRVLFVSDLGGSQSLWSIRVADGKPVGEPEMLKHGFSADILRCTNDGSLFYREGINETDIYIAGLDPASGKITSEPKRVNQRSTNSWGRVAWLPDGKSLSFWNKPPVGALVVHDLATGEEREIFGGKTGRPGPGYTGWFSDGTSLMGITGRNPQNQIFQRLDSRTGAALTTWTVPALPPGASICAYSPDLMTMFFRQRDPAAPVENGRSIFIMSARDLKTGSDRELFRMRTNPWIAASVSPDGRQIAFTTWNESNVLMVAPTAGGQPREVYKTTDGWGFLQIAWTRDGSHILAFRFKPTEKRGIGRPEGEAWSFPVQGGSPEISRLSIPVRERPAVSPDGTMIAYTGYKSRSEVWVLTGLFPAVR